METIQRSNTHKVGAVMVVGGGISGMQSALDLAGSGFKVYLVDEKPSIGGRMAQLDKTFPTNDCSTCLISPKLIEVSKHLNIEILTNASVQSVEGEEGNFRVRVNLKPRYVDVTRCTSCGECARVCPVTVKNEFEGDLAEHKATFKSYPQAIPAAYSILKRGTSPCKAACPAHISAQGYVALIAAGRYKEALDLIREAVPFPGALGRVCTHPCEVKCTRGQVDESISICQLKRFVTDEIMGKGQDAPPMVSESKKKKVAVIGSGPAGLSAAYYLAVWGYQPTVFEALPVPGGMMAVGIPAYRLPKDVLKAEIDFVKSAGVEIRTNTPIGGALQLKDLANQGFEATYVAVGAHRDNKMGIEGEDLKWVIPGVELLRDVSLDKPIDLGGRVAVVGGGNVAIDAARSALRLGARQVTIVYRRSRQEMPASVEEIIEAEEEGVKFMFLTAPNRVTGKDGAVACLECVRMELGEPDQSGRRRPIPVNGSEFKLEVETIIPAIGQAPDLSFLAGDVRLDTARGDVIKADPLTFETNIKGVFAGGDAVLGPSTVVQAIAQGKQAAVSIDRYLRGQDLRAGRDGQPAEFAVPLEGIEKRPRKRPAVIPAAERTRDFREVVLGYTLEDARDEAQRCLSCGVCSECYRCVAACGPKAIDHSMMAAEREIAVGSLILAPGFEPFDPTNLKGEYRYGVAPNVVTSLQFERILSASGPFQGVVKRPSDGKHPVKVAWIQCVGSRDETCGRDYCSSVCCMYATKQSIIAREHDRDIKPAIFFNDMRAFGKGFERYYESAREKYGVRYVRGLISDIKELQRSNNLLLEYAGEDGRKLQEEFDMVVLSIGLAPSKSTRELALRLNVKLDNFGFCETKELEPNVSSRPGVYVAGAFEKPMDIPESVMSGSSAACLAARSIATVRGALSREKKFPPEIDVSDEEPRVGVFICRCGTNIARVVDVPGVADYAKTLPYVAFAEENMYTCSTDTQVKIIEKIKEYHLNRVVVASCSPRTHEPLFQESLREAGLNKYLFEMANIRDQCSWVHDTNHPAATTKARDLVRMAVARVVNLQPLQDTTAPVSKTGLVIGGGVSGMTASLELASQGFSAVLVEREPELGGNLRHLRYTLEGSDPQALLNNLLKKVEANPLIKVYKNSRVKDFSGFVGNYKTTLSTTGGDVPVEHGIVVVATGASEYKPTEYLADQSDKVLTQVELEEMVSGGSPGVKNLKSVVMVQCVGSREKDHLYCSRVCCSHAVKNAIKLKDINPDMQVYVLYRDMRTYEMKELKYREARDKGVVFIRFDADKRPAVTTENGKLKVSVFDTVLGASILMEPDILVLSAAIRPQTDAGELATKLKLPLTQDGFFMEAHMKLRPLDFVNDGMYLCGLAHSPKSVEESIMQARGAVSRASTVLSQPFLSVGAVVSVVDPERCVACLTCVRSCPFNVPAINEQGVAYIEPAACQGCGICTSACPRKAITLRHYSDAQITAKTSVLYPIQAG